MATTKWILAIIFISFLSQPSKYILWEKTRKLTYKDFKGVYKSGETHAGNTECEFTYTCQYIKKQLKVSSKVLFDTENSWLKFNDASLLSHEQIHFDIAEIHIRLFRQRCNNFGFTKADFKAQIDSIFNLTDSDCDAFQQKYDAETKNGTVTSKQKLWFSRIASKILESNHLADTAQILLIR
jgi:predicted secreted Zn-dependent protease